MAAPVSETLLETEGVPPPAAGSTEPAADRPSYRRVLSNRRFSLLWVSQLVSQSGDYIFEVALLWLILEITGSAFAVGVVVTGTILPAVILGPFLGVYVDRWDRRRTLLVTNVLEGVVVAVLSVLVVTGHATLSLVFVVVLMLGSGATVVRVGTNAYVPSVVETKDLPPANGLLSISGSMNAILGLSLGGIFVAVLGVTLPIEYDAISFFAAALLLLFIPRSEPAPAATERPAPGSFRTEFSEGIAFIRQNRFMLEIISIGVIVNFFGNGLAAMLAPYSYFVLRGGAVTYGFLGACFAGGSLVGAAAMGRADTRSRAGTYLFAGGLSAGALVLVLGFVGNIPLALAVMVGLGVALAVTNLPISVLLQAKVPGRLLGRVGAAFGALVSATGPAGPLFAGWLAERWSVGGVFLVTGAVLVGVIGVGAVVMRELRRVTY